MWKSNLIISVRHYISEIFNYFNIKATVATICSVLIYLLGGINEAIIGLFCLMLTDTILGFVRAVCNKKISSFKMRQGVIKFILYFIFILTSNCLDKAIFGSKIFSTLIPFNIRGFSVAFLALTETISIFEHLQAFGFQTPQFLFKLLKSVEQKVANNKKTN